MPENGHNKKNTHPQVKSGVIQPANLNPNLAALTARRKQTLKPAEEYVTKLAVGDRVALSQAITLVESERQSHQALAQTIIEQCLALAKPSIRIGITGTPGVGKSTFIEAFGKHLTSIGRKVAVLAIDPTSQVSRGSILGDKTRMAKLSSDEHAFIRPSAAGKSLGGVARKTRETIILCEAAGFDTIIIETVGVGQSEIAVHSMVDFFLLLLLPGAGDELQGIKRGIVEMADLIAVNKADGERLALAKRAKQEYRNALHLFPPKTSNWTPQVAICSALSGMGIEDVWALIADYQEFTERNNFFSEKRKRQAAYWLEESIQEQLRQLFSQNEAVKNKRAAIEKAVLEGTLSPFQAASTLMKLFLES